MHSKNSCLPVYACCPVPGMIPVLPNFSVASLKQLSQNGPRTIPLLHTLLAFFVGPVPSIVVSRASLYHCQPELPPLVSGAIRSNTRKYHTFLTGIASRLLNRVIASLEPNLPVDDFILTFMQIFPRDHNKELSENRNRSRPRLKRDCFEIYDVDTSLWPGGSVMNDSDMYCV
ncbi:hypothetical protein CC2G_005396 [Coprinopsis cinerea AmutBmut pab1-1]|nr:hypothetical protein CC2G_005396 [Coprinopsis cinerea AmutBmut pab1-1]